MWLQPAENHRAWSFVPSHDLSRWRNFQILPTKRRRQGRNQCVHFIERVFYKGGDLEPDPQR